METAAEPSRHAALDRRLFQHSQRGSVPVAEFLKEAIMIRFASAVVIALCLVPPTSHAQSPRFTVMAASAAIYQAPSAGSPVIGRCAEGTLLDVRRELAGQWIEVAWPNASKGVAYLLAATGVQRPMTIDEFVHGTSAAHPSISQAAVQGTNVQRPA